MHNPPDEPLTSEELDAFAALSRERHPSRMLEERVVHDLRARGMIGRVRHHEPRFAFGWPPLAAAAGIAVSLALFASGIAVGQWLGTRQTTQAMLQLHQQDAVHAAALVERTGKSYVEAMSALASVSNKSTPQEVEAGKAAAASVMHAAANEMVRLAPDDPIAVQILQGLDRASKQKQEVNGQESSKKRLAWF